MLTPSITAIEARWRPELIQQPDIVEIDGRMREVTKPAMLEQELKIRIDWYETVNEKPINRFYREFVWAAKPLPENEIYKERVAASTLIGEGSLFRDVAKDLYALAINELGPIQSNVPFAMPSFVPEFPVARMRVFLPYSEPSARIVELDVHHFLDAACKQAAFKKTHQWVSRKFLQERNITDLMPCEELLNHEAIEPNVLLAIRKCGELVQSIFPTFSIDLNAWMALAEGVINSYTQVE